MFLIRAGHKKASSKLLANEMLMYLKLLSIFLMADIGVIPHRKISIAAEVKLIADTVISYNGATERWMKVASSRMRI